MVEILVVMKDRVRYYNTDHVEIYEHNNRPHLRIYLKGAKIITRGAGITTHEEDSIDYPLPPDKYSTHELGVHLYRCLRDHTPLLIELID